jgi:hypothetical protein
MKPIIYERLGHSGAPPKVASAESISLGPWLWIPGSPLRGAPERHKHVIRISEFLNWPVFPLVIE